MIRSRDAIRRDARTMNYSPTQVARVTGLSLCMIDYLCRHEVVIPSSNLLRGRGRTRQYTFADVVLLRVVAKLLKQGISVLGLRKSFLSAKRRRSSVRELLSRRYFVTDGERIYLQDEGVIERIDTGQLSFAFVLDLVPIRGEVARKLRLKAG
jgi:DNA-binding transcriptional MerR regulator